MKKKLIALPKPRRQAGINPKPQTVAIPAKVIEFPKTRFVQPETTAPTALGKVIPFATLKATVENDSLVCIGFKKGQILRFQTYFNPSEITETTLCFGRVKSLKQHFMAQTKVIGDRIYLNLPDPAIPEINILLSDIEIMGILPTQPKRIGGAK